MPIPMPSVAIALTFLVGLLPLAQPTGESSPRTGCGITASAGGFGCGGSTSTSTETDAGNAGKAEAPASGDSTVGPPVDLVGSCRYERAAVQAPAESKLWSGGSSDTGAIYSSFCFGPAESLMLPGSRLDFVNEWRFSDYVYLENGAPTPPAVPDDPEMVITRYFSGSAQLPNPEIHAGPEPTELAVKVPVWFWVTDPGVEPWWSTASWSRSPQPRPWPRRPGR